MTLLAIRNSDARDLNGVSGMVQLSGIGQQSDFAAISRSILEDLQARVGMDAWLLSRRDGEYHVVLSAVDEVFGIRAGRIASWSESYCAQMLEHQAPMIAADITQVPAYALARTRNGIPAESCLISPVLGANGTQLASLCALHHQQRDDLDDYLSTVQLQGRVLGSLLTNELHMAQEARRREHTEAAASTDLLTGVGTRPAWEAALSAEERRASQYATSAAVIIVKVLALKDANRRSGHRTGDKVLIDAATVLADRIRSLDVLARVGGDDFGVILPMTSLDEAQTVAEDLRGLLWKAGIDAAVGMAPRRGDIGMAGTWRKADEAMRIDLSTHAGSVPSQRQEVALQVAPVVHVTAPATSTQPADPSDLSSIDALLHLAMDQLGMQAAFLKVFEGGQARFRNVVSSMDVPIHPGYTEPLEGTLCQLLVDGQIDEVTPNVPLHPVASQVAMVRAVGVGSWVGIPIHRRDGRLYGTLCTFSLQADDSLRSRDSGILRSVARVAMDLVEVEDQTYHRKHEILRRLDFLYADSGPDIVYQPIQTLDHLETVGVEALSRFPRGSANPDEWFNSATAAGVGVTLELAALRNAVRALPEISGFLSLNSSPTTLVSPGFAHLIGTLPLNRIVLEITEHEPIHDYQALHAVLLPLRHAGLRVSVDDAGAGFASMRHILSLVPDFIKLDISLVRGIDSDRPQQALASAIGAFAVKTGALVIAEGIETPEELDCLRTLNIDYGQGYHLSRPAPMQPRTTGKNIGRP